jgi:hypothetical protein
MRMAIYLDSNVLWSWHTFTEVERLAVSIVARQLGQSVFVASIVAREAEEDHRRALEKSLDAMEQAQATVDRLFSTEVHLEAEPWPDVDDAVKTWRRRLEEFATILPLHDEDAHAAFDREITGTPPAKPRDRGKAGRGGRDAAIWLTVARHHSISGEDGHFLSKDGDMRGPDGQIRFRMREDIGGNPQEMRLYSDVERFLSLLGTPTEGGAVALADLDELASTAVSQWLEHSREVPNAVWNVLEPDLRYSTIVTEAHAVNITNQVRYVQGEDSVIVINARWELVVECCRQGRDTTTPDLWDAVQRIPVVANVQVFLEEREGRLQEAQAIGAQVSSETVLSLTPGGIVLIIGPAGAA